MANTFGGAEAFNGDISKWDVSSVTNMGDWHYGGMFEGATVFNGALNSWDVSSVTSMFAMFEDAKSFNRDISSWNMTSVAFTWQMFNGATSFNQNLCEWGDKLRYHETAVAGTFKGSGCTYEWDPSDYQTPPGPFCASSCE